MTTATTKQFYLLGEDPSSCKEIQLPSDLFDQTDNQDNTSQDELKQVVAHGLGVYDPNGISFSCNNQPLSSPEEVLAAEAPIAVSIDGDKVREVPAPRGLPYFGNFFEIYPDHLGNHQRLFDHYGPLFKTTNMGKTIYQTNDPNLASIFFAETEYFSKVITPDHPLWPIKNTAAGIFLGDTNTEEWRVTHKFLPPALGPKAVRHYAPTMQHTIENAFGVFDELDKRQEAWNVYPYMLKLGSQAVGKLVLGIDFQHFTAVDAPLHELVYLIAESLELNRKISARGAWYSHLPFGDPKKLQTYWKRVDEYMDESIRNAKSGGVEDLDLQTAALKAENMVGMYHPPATHLHTPSLTNPPYN